MIPVLSRTEIGLELQIRSIRVVPKRTGFAALIADVVARLCDRFNRAAPVVTFRQRSLVAGGLVHCEMFVSLTTAGEFCRSFEVVPIGTPQCCKEAWIDGRRSVIEGYARFAEIRPKVEAQIPDRTDD